MMDADNPDDADSRAATSRCRSGGCGVNTRLELFFDRTDEIAKSNNGAGRIDGLARPRRAVDLFDLLKVISGGDDIGVWPSTPDAVRRRQPGSRRRPAGLD